MRTYFLCISIKRLASGPRVKLVACKGALTPRPVVYTPDLIKAVVPVNFLLCVALWFIIRGDLCPVLPCVLSLCFSVLLVLRSPPFGEERAGLCAFRAFVCFGHVGLCLFPSPLGVRNWLRLVIVALPRQAHDVNITSPQRRCNVMTLHRRWGDVIFTSCARWEAWTFLFVC